MNQNLPKSVESESGPAAERIAGGLIGLLVGDALGVPYEFTKPENIPPLLQIEMEPPAGFRRAHRDTPCGTWSDDGAQALCLLASLLTCGRLDLDDFGRRLVNWLDQGYRAVDGRVFDVGITSQHAIRRLRAGHPAAQCGGADEQDNGNGALMRTLPLALWHQGSDAELIEDARRASLPTHAHLRSQLCCALYCLWARAMLLQQHGDEAWTFAVATMRTQYPAGTPERTELEDQILSFPMEQCGGCGYVVDSLHSARLALQQQPDYEGAVRAAIALGHDTDTTACIVGGLAGIRAGIEGIPARWRTALLGQEEFRADLKVLLSQTADQPDTPFGRCAPDRRAHSRLQPDPTNRTPSLGRSLVPFPFKPRQEMSNDS